MNPFDGHRFVPFPVYFQSPIFLSFIPPKLQYDFVHVISSLSYVGTARFGFHLAKKNRIQTRVPF